LNNSSIARCQPNKKPKAVSNVSLCNGVQGKQRLIYRNKKRTASAVLFCFQVAT